MLGLVTASQIAASSAGQPRGFTGRLKTDINEPDEANLQQILDLTGCNAHCAR